MSYYYIATDKVCNDCGASTMTILNDLGYPRYQCIRCNTWGPVISRNEARRVLSNLSTGIRELKDYVKNP
jgi:hypothetical protein